MFLGGERTRVVNTRGKTLFISSKQARPERGQCMSSDYTTLTEIKIIIDRLAITSIGHDIRPIADDDGAS